MSSSGILKIPQRCYDQNLNLYFGTEDKQLQELQETVKQAREILQKIFGEWVADTTITACDSGYRFPDSCYFINLNYTDTLEKRFGVDPKDDYHIHGEASDPESIIFGHSTHPEMAFSELIEQKMVRSIHGGKSKRLMGLYMNEAALYDTDKHVQDNIDDLSEFMSLDGLHIEDIDDIYVLGHSFGAPDYEYFDFLNQVTRKGVDLNQTSAIKQLQDELNYVSGLNPLDEDDLESLTMLNIGYATHHRNEQLKKENLSFLKEDAFEESMKNTGMVSCDSVFNEEDRRKAVHTRFLFEQSDRTKQVLDELWQLKTGEDELPDDVKTKCPDQYSNWRII